jgi:hypothetical protein
MNVPRAQSRWNVRFRLQIIGQKILAHLSPEAGDLRAHWLASTSREPCHRSKKTATNERSTRTSSVAVTYRDRSWQRSPQGIDATLSTWDPRNQLARARASGTPSLSFQPDICGAKRPTQASPPSRGPSGCPNARLSSTDDRGRNRRIEARYCARLRPSVDNGTAGCGNGGNARG